MKTQLPYLNVGCGSAFHQEWTNLDFISTGNGVISHNLLHGIPFPNDSFEVVYHSHILEHFTKTDGEKLINECYRVLKPNGTLRIAIPDLGKIISEYYRLIFELKQKRNDPYLNASYDWIMLELYDQTVRNVSGGGMAKFLHNDKIVNEDFILQRCGYEVKTIIDSYKRSRLDNRETQIKYGQSDNSKNIYKRVKSLIRSIADKDKVRTIFLKALLGDGYHFYEIGKFRSSGEIHQWMYDEYSLTRLLEKKLFKNIEVATAFTSRISNWERFELETVGGYVRKPDSLFIEGSK